MTIEKKRYKEGWYWTLRYRMKHAVNVGGRVTVQTTFRREQLALVSNNKLQNPPKEVEEQAKKILSERGKGADINPETIMLLGDFVHNVYLPWCERKKRTSTYRGYRNLWNLYLKPRCSGWWMRETETHQLTKLLDDVLAEHDLGITTMHHVKAFLSGIFTFALSQGYYRGVHPLNVKQGGIRITFPEARHGAGDEDLHAYTLEEIEVILAHLPEPAATAVAFAAYTGLRRGELAGLTWERYTPPANGTMGRIFVARSVWNGVVGEPKTQESKAPVAVVKSLADRLELHRMKMGNPSSGPIFRQPAMQEDVAWHPLDFNNLTSRVIVPSLEWCKQCGTRRIQHEDKKARHAFQLDEGRVTWHGWHSFRRGLATNLHRLGVPDKIIQKNLRHKQLKTTVDIYLRPNQADKEAGMKVLESALHDRATNICSPEVPPVAALATPQIH